MAVRGVGGGAVGGWGTVQYSKVCVCVWEGELYCGGGFSCGLHRESARCEAELIQDLVSADIV